VWWLLEFIIKEEVSQTSASGKITFKSDEA
jgi:hypothetical protein